MTRTQPRPAATPSMRPPLSAPPPPDAPTALLGGLSPAQFMRRHWQKKPLLVRQALPGFEPLVPEDALFALAQREDVESRLIVRTDAPPPRSANRRHLQPDQPWHLVHGPVAKADWPPRTQAGWTFLVQGVDLHSDAVHALMQRFRFLPDARLDDVMISWATRTGGVGPHFDSYDVFLLQAAGTRRWRIGRQTDRTLQPGVPLKILSNFEPEEEHVLSPGDMLYLPPGWAHDGVAESDGCMTYSIGFRVPQRADLVGELVLRMAEAYEDDTLYKDASQPATPTPAALPEALQAFAADALARLAGDARSLACALGEVMTDPKPRVWFEEPEAEWAGGAVRLDRRTRMMYDAHHVFINGDSFRAAGADARLMRHLADHRQLTAAQVAKASSDAQSLLGEWHAAGWLKDV